MGLPIAATKTAHPATPNPWELPGCALTALYGCPEIQRVSYYFLPRILPRQKRVLAQGRALAFNVATGSRLWATDEFRSFAFFKTFGRAAVTRNGHFDLEWRDASSGEVIAIWGKRDGGFASNVVMAGENVLVEISNNSHRGDGLRLLRVPDALKQRLSNAAKGAMR